MKRRVILVDDHQVVRDGLSFLLHAQGDIEVAGSTSDVRQAVALVKQMEPDVVLMDHAMPELNGIEGTRLILQERPQTCVVILSMYSSKEYVHRAFAVGAKGYLLKESAGAEVVRAIRAVCSGERYLSSALRQQMLDDPQQAVGDTPLPSPLSRLSTREREMLQLVAEGYSSAAIAERLFLSPKTVDTYRSRLMTKLGLHDVTGIVRFAIQHGIIALDGIASSELE